MLAAVTVCLYIASTMAVLDPATVPETEVSSFARADATQKLQSDHSEWKQERHAVWSSDRDMLRDTDKAMHQQLNEQLEQQESVQWARYLRHKNLRAPAKLGSHWEIGKVAHSGHVEELMATVPTEKRLCDKTVTQHHGYFKIDKKTKTKNYFYWLFESRQAVHKNTPLVLWLTGGPGCSSEIALFTENGPCKVDSDNPTRTKTNAFSWNNKAHVLFVDQPAGAGFSYGDESDSSEKMISNDLYHFLQEFVKTYPAYHASPFYIFGESYAGHFVPALAHRVFEGNKQHDGEYIALKGQGIGNGLTDPEIQYQYYPQMAFNSVTTPKVITAQKFKKMVSSVAMCTKLIQQCNKDRSKCFEAFELCEATMVAPVQESGLNVYDLREKCQKPPLCYDMSPLNTYLGSSHVKKALGVSSKWSECNFKVNKHFTNDWMISQTQKIPPLLANGIRTIIYAGDADFVCNWMGNKAWTLRLDWPGMKAFNAAPDKPWKMAKTKGGKAEVVGRERTFGGFTFLQIHKAGHMVPMDQPQVALHMLNSFVQGQALVAE